ncbi:probable ADP-ribosylation factor GTPase-activating protein AGD14 isoform X2 [Mercurialis annua]|uniref:probable ADP-ribosylation factor GTPase-activating protein AGD14 isoform X2 n=1 Tax=Mercurialis annua TaxID=3986 RepID=UPI00215E6AD3|nr:probable ADP-ribosylation factor GTPase-activating protein AGD14 isoform X2 [Mercurialis annua]
MTKKEKEEERVERVIRGLLKLPENRKCINCNSLGPQYVCTTFLTFVCTNCSGVHREFTHRVKSVSMAKFNADEVSALQAGGNERAKQIYFKGWDPHRNSYPDGSNLHRLRDFIKHVYVDRKYSGDRGHDRLPRLKLGDKDDSHENRQVVLYSSGGSRSPSYEDRHERRSHTGGRNDDKNIKYYYDERRSPRYSQENSRSGGFKKSPARFEVVDDRFRDDGFRSRKDSDNHRFSHKDSTIGCLSPDYRKNKDRSSSPVIRPVQDILGENAPRLQIGRRSKAADRKENDASARNQIIASSSSKGSIEGKAILDRNQTSESLIDLASDSMKSDAAAAPQIQENHQSSNEGNSNSDESSKKQEAPQAPKPNTLEFLLYELSVPSVEPGNMPAAVVSPTESMGQMLALPDVSGASATASGGNMPIINDSSVSPMGQLSALPVSASGESFFDGGVSSTAPVETALSLLDTFDTTTPSPANFPSQPSSETSPQAVPDILGDSTSKFSNGQQQYQLSVFSTADGLSTIQESSTTTDGASNNQQWSSLEMANAQGSSSASAEHPSTDIIIADQDANRGIISQHLSMETKTFGRQELPVDLFTASYSSAPGSTPGWQNAAPYGMGYNVQYYPKPMQPYPHQPQAISSNPFDLHNTNPMQVSQFPSMENMRVAVPNVSAPGALSPTSSFDTNSSGLMANQAPSYASAMPLQTSSFPSPASAGAYMGQQQIHLNMPNARGQGGSFGPPNMSSSGYPSSSAPNSLHSGGGNPFG